MLRRVALLLIVVTFALAAIAETQEPELGPVFVVEGGKRTAIGPNENFVTVWGTGDIYGRLFDPNGVPLGDAFQINTAPALHRSAPEAEGDENSPSVAADYAGNFVVAWPNDEGVAARRFDSSGVALTDEIQISAMAGLSDVGVGASESTFVVVWAGGGQLLSSTGEPIGDSFDVGSEPAVAMAPSGNFVVVWAGGYVSAQRYSSEGIPDGPAFTVGTGEYYFSAEPSVAAGASGNFVVAWARYPVGGAPDDWNVMVRPFDSEGTPLSDQIPLCCSNLTDQDPSIAMDAEGNFAVAYWQHLETDLPYVPVALFNAVGEPQAVFQANTYEGGGDIYPNVSMSPAGNFLVTWSGYLDEDSPALLGRRGFVTTLTPSPTQTPTETQTPTPTLTSTETATPTPTPTSTATATATTTPPTATPTPGTTPIGGRTYTFGPDFQVSHGFGNPKTAVSGTGESVVTWTRPARRLRAPFQRNGRPARTRVSSQRLYDFVPKPVARRRDELRWRVCCRVVERSRWFAEWSDWPAIRHGRSSSQRRVSGEYLHDGPAVQAQHRHGRRWRFRGLLDKYRRPGRFRVRNFRATL